MASGFYCSWRPCAGMSLTKESEKSMTYDDSVKMFSSALLLAGFIAEEFGKEKAFEILGKWADATAFSAFARKKKDLHITGTTPRDLYDCFRACDEEAVESRWEIESSSPEGIQMRIKNCPMIESCAVSGWECEEVCRRIFAPLGERLAAIISPALTWRLVQFNPDKRQGCRYEIRYRQETMPPEAQGDDELSKRRA